MRLLIEGTGLTQIQGQLFEQIWTKIDYDQIRSLVQNKLNRDFTVCVSISAFVFRVLTSLVILWERAELLGERKVNLYELLTNIKVEEGRTTSPLIASKQYFTKFVRDLRLSVVESVDAPVQRQHHINKEVETGLDFLRACMLYQRQVSDIALGSNYLSGTSIFDHEQLIQKVWNGVCSYF